MPSRPNTSRETLTCRRPAADEQQTSEDTTYALAIHSRPEPPGRLRCWCRSSNLRVEHVERASGDKEAPAHPPSVGRAVQLDHGAAHVAQPFDAFGLFGGGQLQRCGDSV